MKEKKQIEAINILWVGGHQDQWQKYQNTFKEVSPGWKVTIDGCTGPAQAIEKFQAGIFAFSLVAVEDQVPGMSGLNFCRELQAREVPIPIVILLAEEEETRTGQLVIEALEAGVHDYIIKDRGHEYLQRLPLVVRKVILNFKNCVFRKRSAAALRETEEKFLKAFMLSPNAISISTLEEGRIIEVNESAVKHFGYSRDEMIGKTSIEIGIIKPENRETIKNILMEKDFFNNLEMKIYTHSGEERICLLSAQTISLGGEKCIIQTANDITLRKKMQEELLKSKNLESIGILAAGIARDFNNYLTSIMGNISIAKLSLHDTGKIHRSLNRAEEISIKAADLTGKLLTFSEGGEPIHKKNSIIDIIRDTIEFHFKESDVTFNYFKESDTWPVSGDETQLSQVIYNILLNAVQAVSNQDNPGKVTIKTENTSMPQGNELALKEGDYVRISIEDNGIGIPEKDRDKIFDPFFSTKETMNQAGVGLGLTTSQSIIRKHNGTISVDSREGKRTPGTTVMIYIPAYSEE